MTGKERGAAERESLQPVVGGYSIVWSSRRSWLLTTLSKCRDRSPIAPLDCGEGSSGGILSRIRLGSLLGIRTNQVESPRGVAYHHRTHTYTFEANASLMVRRKTGRILCRLV